jgi:hypothetical protein
VWWSVKWSPITQFSENLTDPGHRVGIEGFCRLHSPFKVAWPKFQLSKVVIKKFFN